jgi:hypothetical protein
MDRKLLAEGGGWMDQVVHLKPKADWMVLPAAEWLRPPVAPVDADESAYQSSSFCKNDLVTPDNDV